MAHSGPLEPGKTAKKLFYMTLIGVALYGIGLFLMHFVFHVQ